VWPEPIITCDVRGMASGCTAAASLHGLQALCPRITITDRQTRQTSQLGYILRLSFLQVAYAKNAIFPTHMVALCIRRTIVYMAEH